MRTHILLALPQNPDESCLEQKWEVRGGGA